MNAAHVLIADADVALCASLRASFERERFVVDAVHDARSLSDAMASDGQVDCIVLDADLPGGAGLELVRLLCQRGSRSVILLAGTQCAAADRVVALELGADDCLSKPVVTREVVARVRSVLRRRAPVSNTTTTVDFGGWRLHRAERCLTPPGGTQIDLTDTEFRLVNALVEAPGHACTRDELAQQAHHRSMRDDERSIDLLVSRLRRKLDDAARDVPRLIQTVRGVGYRFALAVTRR